MEKKHQKLRDEEEKVSKYKIKSLIVRMFLGVACSLWLLVILTALVGILFLGFDLFCGYLSLAQQNVLNCIKVFSVILGAMYAVYYTYKQSD